MHDRIEDVWLCSGSLLVWDVAAFMFFLAQGSTQAEKPTGRGEDPYGDNNNHFAYGGHS